jgi:hypothetical protein
MKERFVRLLLVAALLLAVGAGVAYATTTADDTFTACKLNATGTIRLISPGATGLLGHCTTYETQISWTKNGATGATGAQGPIGATGPAGAAGAKGVDGTNGADGASCLPTNPACVGPKGELGAKGETGAKGDPCPTSDPACLGPKGDKGDPGTNGVDGAAGAKGEPGMNGTNGADGAPGIGFSGYEVVLTTSGAIRDRTSFVTAVCPVGKVILQGAVEPQSGLAVAEERYVINPPNLQNSYRATVFYSGAEVHVEVTIRLSCVSVN